MNTVFFIAYNCPPVGGGGVMRTTKFLKFLPEYDWKPVVLTAHPHSRVNLDTALLKEISSDIPIHHVRGLTPFFMFRALKKLGLGMIRRWLEHYLFVPDKMIGWVPLAYRSACKHIQQQTVDVIYTTSPPHSTHLVGTRLKKKFPHIPWVADFRDAWCENPFRQFPRDSHRFRREEKMERTVFTAADALVFNTESCRDVYVRKYQSLIAEKSFVIPNGFDQLDFDALIPRKNQTFTILHAGSLYGIRSLQPLIDGLEYFVTKYPEQRDKVKIVFLGHLIVEKERERIAHSSVADMFYFQDFVPHRESLQKMKDADLLLLITGKNETDIMIPCKFYEYLGARVPILALTEKSQLSDILTKTGLGKWFDGKNPEEISTFLYSELTNRTHAVNSTIDEKTIKQYERKHQTGQLVKIFNTQIQ